MGVNYRAVHARKPWRKVGIHKTLLSATDGKDGPRNLLLRVGRVAEKWQQYGDVAAVFVWEDGASVGHAFRLKPGTRDTIQTATVSATLLDGYDGKSGCSAADIELSFVGSSKSEKAVECSQSPPQDEVNLRSLGEQLSGWNVAIPYPDDLPVGQVYVEGLARQVSVNAYERSQNARIACITHYGASCQVCRVDFGARYGQMGRRFIHVHHRVPIASVGAEYSIDPIEDLIPVCPNCHAMLHRREPPVSIEELRRLLNDG